MVFWAQEVPCIVGFVKSASCTSTSARLDYGPSIPREVTQPRGVLRAKARVESAGENLQKRCLTVDSQIPCRTHKQAPSCLVPIVHVSLQISTW